MKLRPPKAEAGHAANLKNWARAILFGDELIAPGAEGIKSLELANAIQLSSWIGQPVKIPISRRKYDLELKKLIEKSKFKKKVRAQRTTDPNL